MENKLHSVLLVSFVFILNAITLGSVRLLGVYFIHLQESLGSTASQASLAVSIAVSVSYLTGTLCSLVYNTFGPRKSMVTGSGLCALGVILASLSPSILLLQLSLGVLCGPGLGLTRLSVRSIVGQAFSEKRSLVNNIISASIYCWGFLIVPFMQYLIEEYNWRSSMLLIGAIISNGIPFGLLATTIFNDVKKPQADEIDEHPITAETRNTNQSAENRRKGNKLLYPLTKLFDVDLMSDWRFWFYCLSSGTFSVCIAVTTVYTVRFAQSIGMADYESVFLVSLTQIIIVIFSPISGIITSFGLKKKSREREQLEDDTVSGTRRSWILVSLQAVIATIFLIPVFSPTATGIIAYSVLVGVILGLISGLPYTVLADMFGTEKLPNALGFRSLLCGIFLLCLLPLVGMLVDVFDNFGLVMIMGAIAGYTSSIFMSLAQYGISVRESRKKLERTQRNNSTSEPGS